MKNDVEQLMTGLRTDHRNMALLLDLLDMETERLAASEEPAYDFVQELMRYMTEYPDVVHHPKENLIYRHLKSLHPDIDDNLKRVETDHRHIEESGLKLKIDIEAMSDGAYLNRDEIIANLRHYIEKLREHMCWKRKTCLRSPTNCRTTATGQQLYLRTMRLVTRYSGRRLNESIANFWPGLSNASSGTVKNT